MEESRPFTIVMEPSGVLLVTMSGFWDEAVMDRFESALAAAAARLFDCRHEALRWVRAGLIAMPSG